MLKEQVIIGIAVSVLCLISLWNDRWLLEKTKKGQRLVRWMGETRGLWTLRILFGAGAIFGTLLALHIIRPIQW